MPALGQILPSALILVIPAVLVSAYFGYLTARWLDIRLGNLRRAVQAWQAGDFSVTVQDDVADEIGAFGQGLNSMAGQMEGLLRARGDLAALEERNHLARDLHDSVKQQITAASFQLAAVGALFERDPQAARGEAVLDSRVAARVVRQMQDPGGEQANPFTLLSERELEVLRLVAMGSTNQEIAEKLVIGESTVKTHVGNILGKLNLVDRTQAAVYAWATGIVRREE